MNDDPILPEGWQPLKKGLLLVLVVVFILGALVREARCADQDPLAAPSFSRAYAIGESVFDASGRTELLSGLYVGQLGLGRVALTIRGRASGLPGTFDAKDIKTYRSLEGYAAASWIAWGRDGVSISFGAAGGSSFAFDTKGAVVTTPHQLTAGACGVVTSARASAYLCGGQHQAVTGAGAFGTIHISLTARESFIADGAFGSRRSSFLRLGFAVQL